MLTLLDGLESPHDDERVDIERDPDKPDASANSGDSETHHLAQSPDLDIYWFLHAVVHPVLVSI
jgi:hypothetical protein